MAKQNVRGTAIGAAVCRLIEQYQPEETRLFDDPVVRDLVGTPVKILTRFASMRNYTVRRTDAILPGLYGVQVCRTRFIDEAVQAALSQGIGQLVILGAGLDTRPYRLAGMERVNVFEVDLPSVQEDKRRKLEKRLGRLPENVTLVHADFDRQSLEDVLTETRFDRSKRALFVWEGVTQYISEEAVSRTLTFVGKSAPGSILMFTYVQKSIVEGRSTVPGADRILETVTKNGTPWIFGLDPSEVPSFLKQFHLNLETDVGNADYQARYLNPLRRNLVVSECERVVSATVS